MLNTIVGPATHIEYVCLVALSSEALKSLFGGPSQHLTLKPMF